MKKTITKLEKVEKTIWTCDICGKRVDIFIQKCEVCGKDLCLEHRCNHAGDSFPVNAGNYTCCHDCDKKLQPWRNKLDKLKLEYDSTRNSLIILFKKEFGLN